MLTAFNDSGSKLVFTFDCYCDMEEAYEDISDNFHRDVIVKFCPDGFDEFSLNMRDIFAVGINYNE